MTNATAAGLCEFVDASPSPFHVVESVAALLETAGFTRLYEHEPWSDLARHYVVRGGSIIAFDASFATESGADQLVPLRVVGGHTDSPNLRVKQHPDARAEGLALVLLEPYGGAWLNSWLDRDLGLSGRLATADAEFLIRIDEPLLRVPQLAIHLSDNRKGVELNPQRHVNAVWGPQAQAPGGFLEYLEDTFDVPRDGLLGFELMVHDTAPSALVGAGRSLVSAPRLDNQCTCYAGTQALVAAAGNDQALPVLALFDHEEVGSNSDRGAGSEFLPTILERLALALGLDREDYLRMMSVSLCASGDMAHATHPNYGERHEPAHHIELGGGPVLKVNQNLRYASDSVGEAAFARAAAQAGVPLQRYVHRADLPCGSTIGPITATRTGLTTVDVGAPQLAMHSARELMSAADVSTYAAALTAFLAPGS